MMILEKCGKLSVRLQKPDAMFNYWMFRTVEWCV